MENVTTRRFGYHDHLEDFVIAARPVWLEELLVPVERADLFILAYD